jgi:hypothetical protein
MARPLKWKSHDAATGTGPGREQSTKGHDDIALFVEAYDGFDPSTDTLEVRVEGTVVYEGETDPQDFAQIDRGAPEVDDALFLDQTDFEDSAENSGRYVAYVGANSFAIEIVRANIATHSGGFSVDTTVLVNGAGEAAYRFSTPDGP